ncbi:MAG: ribosomal protein S18-alanine N-acetyltransferase [Desulfuromonadales bacterium]|jgi:ribosomal-protein-alanine N-acetyltransferase|nr:ribosomal protein S18-alanine N-acetyltransferase [Desulfuromonadales bacterium]
MNFEIRPLRETDLEQLVAVERDCYRDPWSLAQFRQELELPHASIDLCWADGKLAGYHCYWLVVGEMQVMNLATAPDFQRHGVARKLLGHALETCSLKGLQRAYLEVRIGNLPAISLYRSFGFVDDGLRRHYYADGEDALLMVKEVAGEGAL